MEDAETIFVHLLSDAPTDFFFMSFFLPNSEECLGRQRHSILEIQKKILFPIGLLKSGMVQMIDLRWVSYPRMTVLILYIILLSDHKMSQKANISFFLILPST